MYSPAEKKLARIRDEAKSKTLVFCSGTFDLTHAGHVLFFEDCKRLGDVLVVAVGPDEDARMKGPGRPVLNQHVRLHMVRSMKVVDHAFINAPARGDNERFLRVVFAELKPDIYAINGDVSDAAARERAAKAHGVKMVVLERTCPPEFEQISTTDIIERIGRFPR